MDLTAPPSPDRLMLALERELRASERVVWSGRRLPRVSYGGFAIWLFAAPWTGFALFWMVMASAGAKASAATTGPVIWAFPLFGLPFLLLGLAMMALPFLPLFGADRTLFAITDRRVLRLALFGKRLWAKSIEHKSIGEVTRTERRNGEGSLRLGLGAARDGPGEVRKLSFSIGEVADVMAADRALHRQLGARNT